MLKMILADDEPMITQGIQVLVDWTKLGIEIVGVYDNGAQALAALLSDPPDFAILDIAMPGQSGLDILRTLSEVGSATRVIFLSGFQDFAYAQQAVRYGAVDYLLKPVKKDSLIAAVQKCIHVATDKTAEDENTPAGHAFFPLDVHRKLALREDGPFALCIAEPLHLDQFHHIEGQMGLFSVLGRIAEMLALDGAGTAFQKERRIWLVLAGDVAKDADGYLRQMRAALLPAMDIGFIHAPPAATLRLAHEQTAVCREMAEYFYFAKRLPSLVFGVGESIFAQSATQEHMTALRENIGAALLEQNEALFRQSIAGYVDAACTIAGGKSDTAVYYLLNCIRMVEEKLETVASTNGVSYIADTMDKSRRVARYQEMEAVFSDALMACFEKVTLMLRGNDKKDILKAKRYIDTHFNENLTLDVLAKHIHMNPFYFSSFFKKQTGENFKDYLNKVRMKRGMELLVLSDKKIYEIAEEVGFRDYRYFTELFNRHYGKTPMAYRKDLLGNQEEKT